jgi:hypothetical protein
MLSQKNKHNPKEKEQVENQEGNCKPAGREKARVPLWSFQKKGVAEGGKWPRRGEDELGCPVPCPAPQPW